MNIDQKFIAQRDAQTDDGVIPLINVVFLMLIFFMVAGQIQKSDPIKITPPESINETRAQTEPNALILVGLDGRFYLGDEVITLTDIAPRLNALFEAAPDKQSFWVQVKADGALSIDQLSPVFTQIRQSGLTKVSVATQLSRN